MSLPREDADVETSSEGYARRAVMVDYPTRRSVNAAADIFFGLDKGVEGNTRPFTVFSDAEVERARDQGSPVILRPERRG